MDVSQVIVFEVGGKAKEFEKYESSYQPPLGQPNNAKYPISWRASDFNLISPRVYFDMTIGGNDVGRIEVNV